VVQPPNDLPRFTEAERRALRWYGLGVVAIVVGAATLPWTLPVAERLGAPEAVLIAALFVTLLVVSRRRDGRWKPVRVGLVALALVLLGGAAVFGVCAATACVR
jgi:hypothetical protein